uniref:hypothetical protein n=1 Tax=Paractinoplanes polyasparticus TaxID=2856853 RepID=UPI0021031EE1|nr:hypothetical protein [Actinoplanes polyasparticus]
MLIARERASSHGQQRGAPVTRTTLTLLHLPAKRTGSAIYGLSTLDAGGRIADRAIMQALGWTPQQRLDIRVSRGLIGVFADERGVFRVSSQRFLHLPVAARRWCDLAAGSRVLLAAYPEGGLLLVYPPAVLDDVVAQVFDAVWGSDVDG